MPPASCLRWRAVVARDRGSGGQNYTGIESGENATSGIGLVEVYDIAAGTVGCWRRHLYLLAAIAGVLTFQATSAASMLLTGPVAVCCFRWRFSHPA
ncbi:MAG: hypothetical protein DME45_11090 [Verrucomicrobia bacterium]|nr:MAG: hypothetical protein DME45_11090 [Verrucomicrobiota bacterium]